MIPHVLQAIASLQGCTTPTSPIYWEGYVYLQSEDGLTTLENATAQLEAFSPEHSLEWSIEGSIPNGRGSNFQRFQLEDEWLERPIQLRVQGEQSASMLWVGETPSTNATWIPGALFTPSIAYANSVFSSIETLLETDSTTEQTPGSATDSSGVRLWGKPLHAEEWTDITIQIQDDAQSYPVYPISFTENGELSLDVTAGIQAFFAWDLPSHPLTLSIYRMDSLIIETTYIPEEGDILSAFYYTLPEDLETTENLETITQ